jgi:transposase
MLTFSGSLRVWVCVEPVDMRKGFEGLSAIVIDQLQESLRGSAIFAFTNKRRTRLKLLYFDGTGLWLMTKRLEQGTYFWPKPAQSNQGKLLLTPEAFALLTDGVDMHRATMRPWYERQETS